MANILQSLIPSFASDLVAVYDGTGVSQIFRDARPIKATVKEIAKLMEHPVETGATITDHRVILPIEIEISFILAKENYQDVYQSIRQYYLNGNLLTVQTRSGTYTNMLIASMPHDEEPEQYNAISIAVTFKQVQVVTPQYSVTPKSPRNATTVNRGAQQGSTPNSLKQTYAQSIYKWIKG